MADQLKVRLVTPDRVLVDQTADAVEVPGKNGYFEVLYGHAPLLSFTAARQAISATRLLVDSSRFCPSA
jgi:F0F1-type ATP synthase epsilon subunit